MNIKSFLAKLLKKLRFSYVKHSIVHSSSKVEAGSSIYFSHIGKYSFCGYDCEINNAEIGSYTSIANNVTIGGARHPMDWVAMSPVFYKGRDSVRKKFSEFPLSDIPKTYIGHDVWIGRSAIVLSGVNVGNGAVIGAGSVVTKDVPAYAIFAGNPAKFIRYRFEQEIISSMERTQWWELDEKKLTDLAKHIRDPSNFILVCKKMNLID